MPTILVDRDRCNRCGICSGVCPAGIISPPEDSALPSVEEEKAGMCLQCGHCEAFCPSLALLLNVHPDQRETVPAGAGSIPPSDLGYYMKMRRSVRHYTSEPVSRETIDGILDIARYAASGGNGQPVEWIIFHDPARVRRIAGLTIDWMRTVQGSGHPMGGFMKGLIGAWDRGHDVICRGAPHLVVAHIPKNNPVAPVDAIIALTHFDIAAPAFGAGTCWAGFVVMAASAYAPLQEEIGIPQGRTIAYAMMLGHPKYRVYGIPRRKPLSVEWR